MISGIDASQLTTLRTRTSDALDELAEVDSNDAAAARAMRAVRLTRYTLEWFWMPAIEDLLSSLTATERSARV